MLLSILPAGLSAQDRQGGQTAGTPSPEPTGAKAGASVSVNAEQAVGAVKKVIGIFKKKKKKEDVVPVETAPQVQPAATQGTATEAPKVDAVVAVMPEKPNRPDKPKSASQPSPSSKPVARKIMAPIESATARPVVPAVTDVPVIESTAVEQDPEAAPAAEVAIAAAPPVTIGTGDNGGNDGGKLWIIGAIVAAVAAAGAAVKKLMAPSATIACDFETGESQITRAPTPFADAPEFSFNISFETGSASAPARLGLA